MGEEDSVAPSPFDGTFTREDGSCVHVRIFGRKDGALAYEVDLACQLNNGSVGVQTEIGSFVFDVESGVSTFYPERATCAGRSKVEYIQTISLNGQATLVAKTSLGTEIFERSTGFAFGPAITTGCFAADGSFVPAALGDL